jgi:DinB family protein
MNDQELEQCLAMLNTTPDWIEQQARKVPGEAWKEKIHGGENGWNRRQMLAHIATIDKRHGMRVKISAGLPNESGVSNQSQLPRINDWNQEQVDARASYTVDQLLAEYRQNRRDFIGLIRTLTPEQRARITIDRAGLSATPFDDWLPHVHEHAVEHMREVVPG